jgi:ArsR family transcriptional regulator
MNIVINKIMKTLSLRKEIDRLHADICSALASPSRILLLYMLAEAPSSVSGLAEKTGISQPSTSRHLKTLRERGLVNSQRDGSTVEYSLSDHRLIEALDILRSVLHSRLARRASLVEDLEEL